MSRLHQIQLVVAVFLLIPCDSASAQVPGDFFRDDFEDGNSRDSEPATWLRGGAWAAEKDEVVDRLELIGESLTPNQKKRLDAFFPRMEAFLSKQPARFVGR